MHILPIQHEDYFVKIYSETHWETIKRQVSQKKRDSGVIDEIIEPDCCPTKFPCYGWKVTTVRNMFNPDEQIWAFVYGVNEPTLEEELKTYYER